MLDEEITLAEMKKRASDFRSLGIVKSTFMRLTNTHNWATAEEKFPTFTSTTRLSQYARLNFKHDVPAVFHTYCQAALDSIAAAASSVSVSMMNIEVNGVITVRLIESEFSSASAQLRDADASYCGAQLMIYRMPVVRKYISV